MTFFFTEAISLIAIKKGRKDLAGLKKFLEACVFLNLTCHYAWSVALAVSGWFTLFSLEIHSDHQFAEGKGTSYSKDIPELSPTQYV